MNFKQPFFLTLCALLISFYSYSQKQKELWEEEQVSKMLNSFYIDYINTFEDFYAGHVGRPDLLIKRLDSIGNLYLSSELHKYIDEVNRDGCFLDVDPFLGGNMIDKPMLDSMSFKKIENDLYRVRYKYGNGYGEVKLRIAKTEGSYKIRDAFILRADGEYELTKDKWRRK